LKKDKPICITGHYKTVQFSVSPNVCFCINWRKQK